MRTATLSSRIVFIIVLFTGCVSVPPPEKRPFIDLAIWNVSSKEKVYDACLTSLHMQGYKLPPIGTRREDGLIVTERQYISPQYYENMGVYYQLQILVSNNTDTQVTISVQVRASYPSKLADHNFLTAEINNMVSDDLKALFDHISASLGPASHIRCEKVLSQ